MRSDFVFLYRKSPGLTVREQHRVFIGAQGAFWLFGANAKLLSFDCDDLERGIVAELGDEIVFVTNDSRVASLWE